jgi:pilus assembly protein CpaE
MKTLEQKVDGAVWESSQVSVKTVLVISPDARLTVELAPLLAQHLPLWPVVEWKEYPDLRVLAETLASRSPTFCFLDVGSNREIALRVLAVFASASPSTQVVVLLNSNDPDLILSSLRQGAAEFMLQPLSSEQLKPVMERLAQLNPALGVSDSTCKVVALMPAKGACGASTIATNLAFQWKRLGLNRALLADLDPSTGVINFLLKLKWPYSFLDALSRSGSLDGDIWRGLVCSTHGVDVLLAPENGVEPMVELPDPSPVIDFIRSAYDVVVLDLGEPFSPWSLSLAAATDQILLVSTNELPALRSAQRVLQHLDRNHIERGKVRLILNRYNPEAGLTQDAIETALHTDVTHVLPSDYEAVQKALVEGKTVAGGTPFTKSLQALAEVLSGKSAAAEATPKRKTNSWTSLLSSFLSRSG